MALFLPRPFLHICGGQVGVVLSTGQSGASWRLGSRQRNTLLLLLLATWLCRPWFWGLAAEGSVVLHHCDPSVQVSSGEGN